VRAGTATPRVPPPGPRELDADDPHAVTNPTLTVEVLSPSTESYDRGDKFEHSEALEYVLVSHRENAIEVRSRAADGTWTSAVARDGDVASLPSVAARLVVAELDASAADPR